MKKLFNLFLALALCMSLAAPALAGEEDEAITLTGSVLTKDDAPWESVVQYANGTVEDYTENFCNVLVPGDAITVTNTSSDETAYGYVWVRKYTRQPEGAVITETVFDEEGNATTLEREIGGKYYNNDVWHLVTEDCEFVSDDSPSAGEGLYWVGFNYGYALSELPEKDVKVLSAGESMTFTLPVYEEDVIYEAYIGIYYPDVDEKYQGTYTFKFDLDAHTTTVGNYTVNYTRAEKKTVVLDGEEQTITLYYVKPDWACVLTDYNDGEGGTPYLEVYRSADDTADTYALDEELSGEWAHELIILEDSDKGILYKMWDRDNNGEPVYIMLEPEYRDSGEITENPFTDVPSGAYYEDAVLWALNNDITNGTSDTTFAPDMTCTRGQVVTFLWRANGCPTPTTTENPFTDVMETYYYYSAVLWAVENGITNGTSATTFSPGATCTSGQVLTFLWRANGSPAAETTGTEYYATAAAWAEENGLLGKTDTAFAAGNSASRAEIVTYLYYNSVNQEG